ncbi:hypothetical protein BV25DRAFT_1913283 [Artomyces pyxidatus]|uniref:Uncharacterized protein n=1 Tax=Artomyces pyxidatus TaxID=48021 RepID=A0ACB8TBG6_9AGAM|nr:hypothetical protein BV25DRAFT_1913283 [Artomyces pyxidatus]
MVEYVYALHDFQPENDDEVPFRAGERIEVVEKDDLYGDGWWQGRNLSGKVGLFPKSYTQPAPPNPVHAPVPASTAATSLPASGPPESADSAGRAPSPVLNPTPLHPLPEEPEPGSSTPGGGASKGAANGDGEVMRATMTDVQKAIEQLGHKDDMDGSHSFTFSSTREDLTDRDTDQDTELDTDAEGEDWYKNTRQKLAERARVAVEEAAAREAADNRVSLRSAPPIDVELSDESEGEEDEDHTHHTHRRRHSHIPEEEEDDTTLLQVPSANGRGSSASIQPSESFIVPSPGPEDANLPTATQAKFPTVESSVPPVERPSSSSLPSPVSSGFHRTSYGLGSTVEDASSRPSSTQLEKLFAPPASSVPATLQDPTGVLPSPAASSNGHAQGYTSTHSSMRASASSPLSQPQQSESVTAVAKKPSSHPSDWTVDEVVDWLRSKGFDEGVCDKFTEQEITGDVLLELDVNVLKSEIGIAAYGKRMRIANAITDLRRPPSVISSDHLPTSSHSQSQSFSHSLTTSSARLSQGSPFTNTTGLSPSSLVAPLGSGGMGGVMSPESPPHTGDIAGSPSTRMRRDSDPGLRPSIEQVDSGDSNATVGLGLGITGVLASGKANKGRPAQLTLSPSDGALGTSVAVSGSPPAGEVEEERAVLSESDTAKKYEAKTKRSRFGRQESTSSRGRDAETSSRNSKDASTPLSDVTHVSEPSKHTARKRSLDATKGDRLSIFGGAFSGSLGKSRKPPPRYSAFVDGADLSPEKSSHLSLSRLYPGSNRKSSGRPSTGDSGGGTKSQDEKREKRDSRDSKEKKDPALLRKRTASNADAPSSRGVTNLKAGESILQQIGSPDHNGWMRKKGDRYNAWKNRYFVLKGPHLYWLRSNSPSETRIKGYVNIVGYRIITDEKVDPGRYGFKLIHENDKTHYFSSDEQVVIREWMKALMKATIDRDYTKPVVSSVNIPTIPLAVAQAMNPAPRPPSPTARAATQKAMRRENTNQLSTRDAQILMGSLPASETTVTKPDSERTRLDSFFTNDTASEATARSTSMLFPSPRTPQTPVPARPSRELRKIVSEKQTPVDPNLIEWANGHLPKALKITDTSGPICGGLVLLRLAESIKQRPCTPPVPDNAFPSGPNDDKLDGLFRLFDFLLDNDVRMGSVSINDVRQGKRDKIIQLLKALRTWEEKRKAVAMSIGSTGVQAGPFAAPMPLLLFD